MPIYEYVCGCGKEFEEYKNFTDSSKSVVCQCGKRTKRKISIVNLVTDTNFGYTGEVDKRLGPKKIEGRKDWKQRVAAKGYVPLDSSQAKDM